ncbi:MAG: hypothetical protein JXB32_23425 [Deltaproteobacteria bacterium]|nr:hypothetical protein [Deltaproteobacteria bacterium]
MFRRALVLPVVAASLVVPAAADELEPVRVHVVGRASADAGWTDGPTEARLADAPELAVVLEAREGRRQRRVYLVDDAVAPLELDGRAVPENRRRAWDALGTVAVRWSAVEPHAWRPADEPAPNGSTTPYYSNVVSGGDDHGEWLGWDRVSYFATPLGDWTTDAAARRRPTSARPPRATDDLFGGLGTLRYQVELRLDDRDGATLASPGPEAVDTYGLKPTVHRVSIRRDDSYLGWLTSYFLVPEVFGSAGPGANHQTERYVGADCADVLVGALHAGGHDGVPYTGVAALDRYADAVAGPGTLDDDGRPEGDPLTGVAPGDVIRIDYGGAHEGTTPRSWDHVAVLFEDRSDPDGPHEGRADGELDGFDLVVHMGHPQLKLEPLSGQCPARVDVLRWDPGRID